MFMTNVTSRLTDEYRDRLRPPMLDLQIWDYFTFSVNPGIVCACVVGHIPALSCAPDLRVADCLSMILRQMFPHAFEGTLHVHSTTNAINSTSDIFAVFEPVYIVGQYTGPVLHFRTAPNKSLPLLVRLCRGS